MNFLAIFVKGDSAFGEKQGREMLRLVFLSHDSLEHVGYSERSPLGEGKLITPRQRGQDQDGNV